ncbi:MAG: hypothetical protein AB8B48_03170 [Pseudomonadales bacterium]
MITELFHTKNLRYGLLALAALLVVWIVSRESNKGYVVVKIDDVPEQGYFLYQDDDQAYIVFRNRVEPTTEDDIYFYDVTKERHVVDPPFNRSQQGEFGVLAVEVRYGYLLLPAFQWWDHSVPCMGMQFTQSDFVYQHERVPGGIRCQGSLSDWWANNLVYDLNGRSRSAELADIYIPQYFASSKEIRIGVER